VSRDSSVSSVGRVDYKSQQKEAGEKAGVSDVEGDGEQ